MSKDIEKVVEMPVQADVAEEVVEKPYTLRELNDEDLYTVIEILGIVLPDDAKEAFAQAVSGEKSLKEIGGLVAFDMLRLILKNFSAVKPQVYSFLSDLSGIPVDDIRKMPFGTTPKMLKEVFQENASFFKELFKSFL